MTIKIAKLIRMLELEIAAISMFANLSSIEQAIYGKANTKSIVKNNLPKFPTYSELKKQNNGEDLPHYGGEVEEMTGKVLKGPKDYHNHLIKHFTKKLKDGNGHMQLNRTLMLGRTKRNTTKLGNHWSEDVIHVGKVPKKEPYVYSGKVHHSDIDWNKTFHYRHNLPYESEVYVKDGAKIKDLQARKGYPK